MGVMTGLAATATFLTVLLSLCALVIAAAFVVLAALWFAALRPIRLSLRESIPTFYLRGHFARYQALTH